MMLKSFARCNISAALELPAVNPRLDPVITYDVPNMAVPSSEASSHNQALSGMTPSVRKLLAITLENKGAAINPP